MASKERKLWPWLVLLGLVALAFATCPNEQAHKDELASAIKVQIKNANLENLKDGRPILNALNSAASTVESSLMSTIGLQSFLVEEYGVFSIGRIHFDEDGPIVTLGLFGHVFVHPHLTDLVKKELSD